MKNSLLVLMSVPVACGVTVVWWRLWMYDGLVGPPPILQPFIATDGEGSYDRVGAEMSIVVWTLALCAIGLSQFLSRQRRS